MKLWILSLLFIAPAASATCVDDLQYPTTLALPSIERWATESVVSSGDAESECKMVRELVSRFDVLESSIANGNGGSRLRGTHAKGTCFKGDFTAILDDRLPTAKFDLLTEAPVFAGRQRRPTFIRFANGGSRIDADYKADVRALSFKIDIGDGRTQDFSFNNAPRFQIPDLDSFVRTMDVVVGVIKGDIRTADGEPRARDIAEYLYDLYGPVDAVRYLLKLKGVNILKDEDTGFHKSYATQSYWSATPFAVGTKIGTKATSGAPVASVVRFGARPCDLFREGNFKSQAAAKSFAESLVTAGKIKDSANYLGETLLQEVSVKPLCFKIFADFLDEEPTYLSGGASRATALVEDASEIWRGPSYEVGTLRVSEAATAGACEASANGVNVTRNEAGLKAIGQINRARAYVEAKSQAGR